MNGGKLNGSKERSFRRNGGKIALLAMLFLLAASALGEAQEQGGSYRQTNLVSTVIGPAPNSDSSLLNPRGLAIAREGGPWIIADEGSGRATLYTESGTAFPGLSPLVISIPRGPGTISDHSYPTGVVYNGSRDFELEPGVPSTFIFVTRDGVVAGWNEEVDRTHAVLVVDNGPDAVYTGVALARRSSGNALYAANFRQGRVDVFGPDFSPLFLSANAFTDPAIPGDYSPYNIQNINGELFVTYAEPGTGDRYAEHGAGRGYVDVYDPEGVLLLRLQQGPWLDAPWGVALAPLIFGSVSQDVLVGNSGSGRIAAFDIETGGFLGFMPGGGKEPLVIPGLCTLAFGRGGLSGPSYTLFYTAGSATGGVNLFGALTPGNAAETLPLTPPPFSKSLY